MSLSLIHFLAMTIGPSISAAARPAATFLVIQLVVAALVYHDLAACPPAFAWLISVPAIILAAVLAGLETAAKHDPDIAALLRDLRVDNATGAFAAFSAALLFSALGLPVEDAGAPTGTTDLLDAVANAATADHSTAVQVGAIGGALGINLGLTWLRSQLLTFVDDFELGVAWARLETGGVFAVLLLLPFLPLLALGFLLTFAALLVGASLLARGAAAGWDRKRRVACESCAHMVRREASICPSCRAERTPEA